MLMQLFRFECRYHFKQVSFKAALLVFFLLGILAAQGGFGGEVYKNSPYAITSVIGLFSMNFIFVATLLGANVLLRDTTYKMESILFTTSIKRTQYFIVRFLGLLTAMTVILLFIVPGMIAGSWLIDAAQRGPFRWIYYTHPLLVFGLPNILFSGSLIVATALLTRNVRAVYLAGVLLYILYVLGSVFGNSPMMATSTLQTDRPVWLPVLLDPFGLAAFFGETRNWSDVQRNQQLFPIDRFFVYNRLLWTGFSALVLFLGYRFFRFRLPALPGTKQDNREQSAIPLSYHPVITTTTGNQYSLIVFWSQLKLDIRSICGHIPFLVMLLLWIMLNSIELYDNLFSGLFGISTYPSTGIIAEQLLSVRPALLLLLFYAAELTWRERTLNMQSLINSAPARDMVFYAAKAGALALLTAIIITANIAIGVAIQLATGYFPIDWPVYLSLYYYSGLPLFLFALLALFIQTMVPNKYLGLLLSFVMVGLIIFSRRLGIEHYLLRYAMFPDLQYSAMNGFGHYARSFGWYLLYWGALAMILSLLAAAWGQNGRSLTAGQRFKALDKQWGKAGKFFLAVSLLVWIGSGCYIFYQTNSIGKYKNSVAWEQWRLGYEQQYKSFSTLSQPVITHVKTVVDLYPVEGNYRVKGNYQLVNSSTDTISRILMGVNPEVTTATISIDGVTNQQHDPVYNQYWFYPQKPLVPGATATVHFTMEVIRSGFLAFNNEHSVVENGSYVELEKYLPFIGYNGRLESSNIQARRQRGLSDPVLPLCPEHYQLIDLETTISTAAGQQVVTAGTLQRSWTANDRSYFTYKTTEPIAFMLAFSSARYAVKKENYKGIALSICYQPGQEANVPAMMQATKDALDYGSAQFSPYTLPQLTVAEIPQYRGSATAYPGLAFGAERLNFMTDFRDTNKVNYAYATMVHEVAHQWWANQLDPANGPGAAFLSESLAKYMEAMLVEKRFGKMYLRSYLQGDNTFYFVVRQDGTELPLLTTDGEPYIAYQKGGLTMYALKERLGEKVVNAALRNLLSKHRAPQVKARSVDLLHELQAQATPEQAAYIDECLQQIVLFDLRMKVDSCTPLEDGQYKVQLTIEVKKTAVGKKQGAMIDEWIDIAVFDQEPDVWNAQSIPVYLQKHHFTKNTNTLTLVLNKKPAGMAVDPFGYLLDAEQRDNVQSIK